jgi:predicted signal transduction protein with EAL and GGDEF domain
MVNGTLVVDAVVHAANATRENVAPAIEPMAEPLLEAAYGLHAVRRGRASPGRRSEARRLRVRSSDMAAHAQIYEALSAVYDTCSLFNRTNLNIVEMGLVHDVEQDGDTVRVRLL